MSPAQGDVDALRDVFVQDSDYAVRINASGLPYLALDPLARRLALAAMRSDPVGLLSPYRRAIPLVGRDAELQALWNWVYTPPRVSVQTLVGVSRNDRTRLAIELLLRLEDAAVDAALGGAAWCTGWAEGRELRRFNAQQDLSAWRWRRPTLIVVEEPAAHVTAVRDFLRAVAAHPSRDAGPPLRILLLETCCGFCRRWLERLQ